MFKALLNLPSERVCRGRGDWILTLGQINGVDTGHGSAMFFNS